MTFLPMTRVGLAIAIVFAVAAIVAVAFHAGPALLGWTAAIAALGVAIAATAAARDLRAPDDLREPRHALGPTSAAALPPDMVARRGALDRLWGIAAGAFAMLGIAPFIALARGSAPRGTAWTAGARVVTPDGVAVRADTLLVGGVTTVFPAGHVGAPAAATMLIRLPPDVLRVAPGRAGWAPSGNVAYSKICTHAGCPVAIYRHKSYQLYCPCHQSVFDVLDAARPIAGPATRALPQLALEVDADGYLVARGDYDEPVGPDSWWRTI
jgi:ubiquinol-cytochrome c reductase iron-sulfur subunit